MKVLNTLVLVLLAGAVSAQVGIGTSTPSVSLDIETSDAAIDINNTSTDPLIHFQVSGTTHFTIGTDVTDSKFKIGTTALETGTAITIESDGDVGIGTTSPAADLDVDGTVVLQSGTSISEFSIDGTMAGNSDNAVPTEQAVKEYIDAEQQVLTKTIIIESPANTDYFPVFRTDVAITIVEALGMLNAAGDVDVRLYWDSDFAETSPTAIGTTTTLTTTSAATVNISSDATIAADNWVFVDIPESTSAQTVTVNIRYTED